MGGGAPFDESGHLVIQPRTSSNRSVLFYTGATTPSQALAVRTNDILVVKPLVQQKSGTQSLSAATTIMATGLTHSIIPVVGSSGAVALTSAPSLIAGTYDGQLVVLQGTNDINTVTLYDHGFDPGAGAVNSSLQLEANSRVLGLNDYLVLRWMNAFWIEENFVDYSSL